ncbi:MAG: amidohydrolase family protein [Proteobacteria bacterium]|nr:amidohydrolase family protein [Pseudomonadota bacterium]MDA1135240.1 amidohydrolase family protein [Pseudomonadota bacterium]
MNENKSPHLPVRQEWLDQHIEDAILPDLPITDPHHHLWDAGFGRYYVEELLKDIKSSGHNVESTVYIMSSSNTKIYAKDGPEEFRPLSEIKFATDEAKRADLIPNNHVKVNASIVGSVDLTFGKKLKPVLEKAINISEGRLKGIRMLLASHQDPRINSGAVRSDLGLMLHPNFIDGAKCIQNADLSLDFWIYHTQLHEMEQIARALPDLTIILNHVGGPIHLGEYEGKQALTHREWRSAMMRLAKIPNINVKLGGLGMAVNGAKFHENNNPPNSTQLSNIWKPWIYETLDMFGFDRCMFESNFPVDKGSCSYGVLWNAFKILAKDMSEDEKNKLFKQNASRIYKIKS